MADPGEVTIKFQRGTLTVGDGGSATYAYVDEAGMSGISARLRNHSRNYQYAQAAAGVVKRVEKFLVIYGTGPVLADPPYKWRAVITACAGASYMVDTVWDVLQHEQYERTWQADVERVQT